MATIVSAETWPDTLKRERSLSWIPDFQNEAGPQGLDGTRQYRNTTGGGLWRCAFTAEQLRRREHVIAWLRTETRLQGGRVPVDIPYCGYRRAPGSGGPVVIGPWAARATTGLVHTPTSLMEEGTHFSVYDSTTYGWRLHRVSRRIAGGSGTGADDYLITFWPPLRFAVADAVTLEVDAPKCVMRLATSGSMDLDLEFRKRGNPNAEFVEAY